MHDKEFQVQQGQIFDYVRIHVVLCIYRALNHIDRNTLWINLNAGDINRNTSQCSADVYTQLHHFD